MHNMYNLSIYSKRNKVETKSKRDKSFHIEQPPPKSIRRRCTLDVCLRVYMCVCKSKGKYRKGEKERELPLTLSRFDELVRQVSTHPLWSGSRSWSIMQKRKSTSERKNRALYVDIKRKEKELKKNKRMGMQRNQAVENWAWKRGNNSTTDISNVWIKIMSEARKPTMMWRMFYHMHFWWFK